MHDKCQNWTPKFKGSKAVLPELLLGSMEIKYMLQRSPSSAEHYFARLAMSVYGGPMCSITSFQSGLGNCMHCFKTNLLLQEARYHTPASTSCSSCPGPHPERPTQSTTKMSPPATHVRNFISISRISGMCSEPTATHSSKNNLDYT